MPWRKAAPHDVEDMIALVSKGSDEMWSVQWAQEAPGAEQAGRATTADSAKAFVESHMGAITRLRWERLGNDWVAYRRSR